MTNFCFKVENCPSNKLAFTNRVFVSPEDFARIKSTGPDQGTDAETVLVELFVGANGWVFTAGKFDGLTPGAIGVGGLQRRTALLTLDQEVRLVPSKPGVDIALSNITIVVDLLKKTAGAKPKELDFRKCS